MHLRTYSLRLFPLLAVVILLCASARAQGPVRLSPYEPTAPGVAPWFANQSIDGIDSIALAVWGTNVAIGGREVAEAIYGQLLVSGKPVGTPRRLTPPDARPFLVCKVVTVGRRFALLWNDARGDTSIRVQLVDRSGDLEGEPRIFSNGVVLQQGEATITPFGFPEGGRLLAWIDGRSAKRRTIVRRIEFDGRFDSPETIIGNDFFGYRSYTTLPGTTFICAGDSTAMIDPAGIVHRPFVATKRFQLAHAITADSTMLLLRDTSLVYYGSPTSIVETRRIVVPNLVGVPDTYRGVSLPVNDTVTVVFATSNGQQVWFRTCTIVDGISSPNNTIYTTDYSPVVIPGVGWSKWNIDRFDRSQPCGNGTQYIIKILYEFYTSSLGYRIQPGRTYAFFSDSGKFQLDRNITCQPNVVYSIVRVAGTDSSRVSIVAGEISSTVAVPTFSWVRNLIQHRAGIFISEDVLYVSWQNDTIGPTVSLGRWKVAPNDTIISTGMTPNYYVNLPLFNTSIALQLEAVKTTLTFYGDPKWIAQYSIRAPQKGKFVEISQGKTDYSNASFVRFLGAASDPNLRQAIVAVGLRAIGAVRVICVIDSLGTLSGWLNDEIPIEDDAPVIEFLSVKDSTTLWIADTIARRRTGRIWGDTLYLPPTPYPAHYQRLYGPHFLRWFESDSTRREIVFQRFSIDGILLDSSRLRAEIPVRDLRVVPDPRDSSVLVVYSNTEGLRLLGFRPALDRIDIDTLLVRSPSAASPSAVVRHDSLFVVWQDIGEGGGMDIYGLRLRLPRGGKPAVIETGDGIPHDASGSSREEGVRDVTAVPNPASESVELRYHLIETGSVALEVVDDRGEVVGRDQREEESAGEHRRTVSVAALPSGAYALVLRGDGWSQGVRVVVVR